MAGNISGEIFRLITFGESHGPGIGGVVEGCPAGVSLDEAFIRGELRRRSTGRSPFSSARLEEDHLEILSGVYQGITLGTPIGFLIRNKDHHPGDYVDLDNVYRPSHADFTTERKYGIRDPRGGGRASGRETAARVVAGGIAKLFLRNYSITISSCTCRIGPYILDRPVLPADFERSKDSPLGCPDEILEVKMLGFLEELRKQGDTTGGIVACIIRGLQPGLGEPVFDKLHADLGKAILSIGACKGFEIGEGFVAAGMKGSEHNDEFICRDDRIMTETNHSGGIQGGISNGVDIFFRAAFKPVPSIHLPQKTVDVSGRQTEITLSGRHDVCVIPRVLPVVEAMSALVMADHLLRNRASVV